MKKLTLHYILIFLIYEKEEYLLNSHSDYEEVKLLEKIEVQKLILTYMRSY